MQFVGGPANGRRMDLDAPPPVFRVPIPAPVSAVSPKVIPYRRSRYAGLSFDVAEYRRFGRVYWWEGLIDDAWCHMDVSRHVLKDGGAAVRRMIREDMRARLQELAPDKGLGRIVWVVSEDVSRQLLGFGAFVGPRAVEIAARRRDDLRTVV